MWYCKVSQMWWLQIRSIQLRPNVHWHLRDWKRCDLSVEQVINIKPTWTIWRTPSLMVRTTIRSLSVQLTTSSNDVSPIKCHLSFKKMSHSPLLPATMELCMSTSTATVVDREDILLITVQWRQQVKERAGAAVPPVNEVIFLLRCCRKWSDVSSRSGGCYLTASQRWIWSVIVNCWMMFGQWTKACTFAVMLGLDTPTNGATCQGMVLCGTTLKLLLTSFRYLMSRSGTG